MDRQQQDIAYGVLKAIERGEFKGAVAKEELIRQTRLNRATAEILIYVYRHMLRGQEFKRALSTVDFEYMLERIGEDGGAEGLRLALRAFQLHIEYRERSAVSQPTNRMILARQESRLEQMRQVGPALDLHSLNAQFETEVRRSQRDGESVRRARLQKAGARPSKVIRQITMYIRNPDVVAEVLHRADGVCEACGQRAPFFRRSDGTPYLEVHHIVPLSEEGEDVVTNAVALCPNCHRRKHFGDSERM